MKKSKLVVIIVLILAVAVGAVAAVKFIPRADEQPTAQVSSASPTEPLPTEPLPTETQTAEAPTAAPYTGTNLTTVAQVTEKLITGYEPYAISAENSDGSVTVVATKETMDGVMTILRRLELIDEPSHSEAHEQTITVTYSGSYQALRRFDSVFFSCGNLWYSLSAADAAALDELI